MKSMLQCKMLIVFEKLYLTIATKGLTAMFNYLDFSQINKYHHICQMVSYFL